MLVLSRKAHQKIYLGDDIVLEVRRIAGNRVTVAIEAPKSIRILRGELKEVAEAFEPSVDEHKTSVHPASPIEHIKPYLMAHRSINSDNTLHSI